MLLENTETKDLRLKMLTNVYAIHEKIYTNKTLESLIV